MSRYLFLSLLCYITLAACTAAKKAPRNAAPAVYAVATDSINLFDSARNRPVPLALYFPAKAPQHKPQRLVLLSHGYNANQPGANLQYSYIARMLASKGYYVASIQHELATDSLLPGSGIPQVVRRSNWERGAQNILFVLQAFKKWKPALDYDHVILIGHSNGGDMSMLFAQQHPALADKVISLDNRRVALPRTRHPEIYSIRSSDQPADEGVLPTAAEQEQYGIVIVQLKNTIHNDMDDDGTADQKKEINNYISRFIEHPTTTK